MRRVAGNVWGNNYLPFHTLEMFCLNPTRQNASPEEKHRFKSLVPFMKLTFDHSLKGDMLLSDNPILPCLTQTQIPRPTCGHLPLAL